MVAKYAVIALAVAACCMVSPGAGRLFLVRLRC